MTTDMSSPVALPARGPARRSVLRVPMRDGAALVADLYTADDQPRPVVLERTPYGRRTSRSSDQDRHDRPVPTPEEIAQFFVDGGYHVVRQDCRGRGDSEGTFVKYLTEGPDGADTIDWIADQPWCDGRVVMTGVSYSAHVQSAAAAEGPRDLVAMIQDSGGFASAYDAGMRMGGAFELKQVTWAVQHGADSPEAQASPVTAQALRDIDLRAWFTAMPWRAGASPLSALPSYEGFLLEQWAQDSFGPYYRSPALYGRGHYEAFPDCPSLHLGSWYDPYVRSTIENFQTLGELKSSPSYLVMGPWTHGHRCVTFAGDVDFGPAATLSDNLDESYLAFRLRWFDSALGRAPGEFPRVRYFLMGGGDGRRDAAGRLRAGGRWLTDTTWPPRDAVRTVLFLHADGRLDEEPPTAGHASVSYDYDPKDPVPTIGGQVTSGEPVMAGGAYDQTPDARTFGAAEPHLPLNSRPDVISLVTEPLRTPVAVAGPVSVRLFLSSTAVDTDVTVKLVDVYPATEDHPHGFAMNLTDGILRARFHESFEQPSLLEPGRVYELTVAAPDTANLFAAGHRIRLDVSSSNFPRFDVNHNTGEGEAATRRSVVATNTVHMDADHLSELTVWVLPDAAAKP